MAAFPVNPHFRSKSAEHDVTLTSFTGDLSKEGRHNFYNVCKIDARGLGDIAKKVVIVWQTVWEISRKKREGAMNSPHAVGRGLNYLRKHYNSKSYEVGKFNDLI